ncbi:hypothetical protein NDA11_000048 [Ustilago hordei]|uniref:Uncharacterized protein n=1 Tax=Ustilago hordei TaxID=120017 RepID=I2G145_USTHO|nr:hypothetical protein NDA10_003106 [Ustilago hordei]KAJ1581221.1 hypothetical protein NDA15_006951 [Ustilago hordei]KAJ1582937.1 hypothetical protein NDA12_005855 [Ustilago hordei]KAJ1588478.1 hypothetical protein NDA11_000048 [Ustilago hordei]KAJ1599961.1 hypothetical protein NDA14_006074 [Ustilago hordei]
MRSEASDAVGWFGPIKVFEVWSAALSMRLGVSRTPGPCDLQHSKLKSRARFHLRPAFDNAVHEIGKISLSTKTSIKRQKNEEQPSLQHLQPSSP